MLYEWNIIVLLILQSLFIPTNSIVYNTCIAKNNNVKNQTIYVGDTRVLLKNMMQSLWLT